jgi:hypothetical protein
MFTLNATNPQPFACQGNPFPSATDTVTLTAPACTSGNGVHTVPSGSFATTWTDPDPAPAPVPAKLSLVLGPKSTYSGVSVFDCNGRFRGAGWGYSRCATYTVLDQTQPGKPILNTTKYTANESVSVISTTYIVDLNTNSNASIKNDGKFTDFLTLVNPNGPIPAGTKGVTKQVITIIDTTNNAQYQVRVNCNVRTDSDVTVNDVTGKADQSCKGF